jgi:phospholipase C
MKLVTLLFATGIALGAQLAAAAPAVDAAAALATRTPIKHLIVVVGENVTFDTLFATYVPAKGESVKNLLSQRIVNADGTPGANYHRAVQYDSRNLHGQYSLDPVRLAPYQKLAQPTLIGAYDPATFQLYGPIPDARFAALGTNGPFQITKFTPYGSGTGDPAHRFFQMWQQTGGTNSDLHGFAWVATTVGTGGDSDGVTPGNTGQGGELMGFYNMSRGDAPYFRALASQYTLSDNYHQAIQGGTGANFFALATGDLPVYNSGGLLAVPPANQIENPEPLAGTDNFYTRDGYHGGSYVNCADSLQPGVNAIRDKLQERHVRANCATDAYYLVNNYDPPFDIAGNARALGANLYVYPPQSVPTIGEALSARGVSWGWYTGGRDLADITGDPLYPQIRAQVALAVPPAYVDAATIQTMLPLLYNTIGDPLNASAAIVGGPLRANLHGLDTFYGQVAAGSLPAVSWVVPKNLDSGHPGYSVPALYEKFIGELIARVQANPDLWASTAILVTTDEGGGYFDSGRIQMLDFFGDGPRIPLLLVSPFARRGHVDHVYNDHASILKFIERNWQVPQLSARSRDRLPNPEGSPDAYLPDNAPAIGDLMSLFSFGVGSGH